MTGRSDAPEALDAPREPAGRRATRGFPKSMRLTKRSQYLAVQSAGRRIHSKHFVAVVAPREPSDAPREPGDRPGRIGITVTKKVGNAVVRNRIKRWVREHARTRALVPAGADVVVIAKHSAASLCRGAQADEDLARLATRLRAC